MSIKSWMRKKNEFVYVKAKGFGIICCLFSSFFYMHKIYARAHIKTKTSVESNKVPTRMCECGNVKLVSSNCECACHAMAENLLFYAVLKY